MGGFTFFVEAKSSPLHAGVSARRTRPADDLDAIVFAEISSDRRLGNIGLAVQGAHDRICEFFRFDHHHPRIRLVAIAQIGCDENRADQHHGIEQANLPLADMRNAWANLDEPDRI